MKTITATVRFSRHGEYENSEDYDVEIPIDTKEDDEVEVIMNALRPILQDEYRNDDDWQNGDMSWTLYIWE
jgi:hypothetical protein